jgi:protein-(glutamine-N5) methyltransferase, release factor-specific
MSFAELKHFIHQRLGKLYESTEIQSFYFMLLAHYGHYSKVDVLTNTEEELPEEVVLPIKKAIKALLSAEPIQYVLGETEFCSYRFFVTKDVLIPRPETEELVDWVYRQYKTTATPLKILDIGTGSGAIAISLKKLLPQAEVTAIDVSAEALAIARRNAKTNGATIHFVQQDILMTDRLPEKYDVIISNPPYVRFAEQAEMHPNVLNYEPHLALFVSDENPLLFYDKIAELAYRFLTPQGSLFFEINQYLGKETQDLVRQKGFNEVILQQDLLGNDRMLFAKR